MCDTQHMKKTPLRHLRVTAACEYTPCERTDGGMQYKKSRREQVSCYLAQEMLRRYHSLRKRLSRALGGVASFNADNTRMTLWGEVYYSAEARFVRRGSCCGSEDTWWVWLLDGVDVIGSDFLY